MPTDPGPRLGLIAPLGSEPINQVDDQLRALVAALEAKAALYQTGTAAARPPAAAGNAGTIYHATDTGVSYISTGTKWRVHGGHTAQLTFTARTTIPDGFLLCTGQAITTAYPELRAALIADGSPHGTSGSNPLAPPAPSRALIATGQGTGLTNRTVGATFGEEKHTMLEVEMVAHSHLLRAATISGGIPVANLNQGEDHVRKGGANSSQGETETVGGGQPFNVMQPSIALNLLIQT